MFNLHCNYIAAIAMAIGLISTSPVYAASQQTGDAIISLVAVNGGVDTMNPGTTCVQVSTPVLAACPSGYVAILNNNKLLIAAALQAKAASSKVWFYYDDSSGSHHCPGIVMTPCSVNSIGLN